VLYFVNMKDIEPRRINFRQLSRVGGALLAVSVALGACNTPDPEAQAYASHNYEVIFSNSDGLARDKADCYTNDKPILSLDNSKADVKITNSICFGETDRFGIPDTSTSFPELEVVADSITVIQTVQNPSAT